MGLDLDYWLFFSAFEERSIAARLQSLCATIIHSGPGFHLINLDGNEDTPRYNVWMHTLYPKSPLSAEEALIDPNPLFTPSLSPILSQSLDAFAHRQLEVLSFQALSNDRGGVLHGLNFTFGMSWGDQVVQFSTSKSHIDYSQERESYWQMLPNILYEGIHPLYIYGPRNAADDRQTPFADVEALTLPYMYEVNVYGPPLVAKFGRERLLATPHSVIEEFADGGIYVWATNAYAAGDYLGLKDPYP